MRILSVGNYQPQVQNQNYKKQNVNFGQVNGGNLLPVTRRCIDGSMTTLEHLKYKNGGTIPFWFERLAPDGKKLEHAMYSSNSKNPIPELCYLDLDGKRLNISFSPEGIHKSEITNIQKYNKAGELEDLTPEELEKTKEELIQKGLPIAADPRTLEAFALIQK